MTETRPVSPPRAFGTSRWGALVLSCLVLVAAVTGIIVRPLEASELVYAYSLEEGQTRVYSMSMLMRFTPQGIPGETGTISEAMKGKMTMKVVEVKDDGSTLLEMRLSDVSVTGTLPEGSAAEYEGQSIKMRVSKSGEVLSFEGSGLPRFDPTEILGVTDDGAGANIGSSNLLPTYPSKELGPGDTWTESADVPLPFGKSKMHFTATGKHLGFIETKYGRTARMNMKMNAPLDLSFSFAEILALDKAAQSEPLPPELEQARMVMDGAMRGDMTARVIPETGDLVAMVMNMKMNIAMRMENLPAEIAAGTPASFRMLGDITMKLDRIA